MTIKTFQFSDKDIDRETHTDMHLKQYFSQTHVMMCYTHTHTHTHTHRGSVKTIDRAAWRGEVECDAHVCSTAIEEKHTHIHFKKNIFHTHMIICFTHTHTHTHTHRGSVN